MARLGGGGVNPLNFKNFRFSFTELPYDHQRRPLDTCIKHITRTDLLESRRYKTPAVCGGEKPWDLPGCTYLQLKAQTDDQT